MINKTFTYLVLVLVYCLTHALKNKESYLQSSVLRTAGNQLFEQEVQIIIFTNSRSDIIPI